MAAVPDKVLNWLYSVLTSEYHDVNRTYSDVAQVLSHYPSISPRTEVHTFENGSSALLLQLSGTLPVAFRGTTYRFPVQVWIPHEHPRTAPMVYVTPSKEMMVRPGQHVSGDGRVYHPYLANWHQYWDRSSLLDFLEILRGVFAKEPPVISKQERFAPMQTSQATPPPVPPPPADFRQAIQSTHTASPSTAPRPPPKPPKPGEASTDGYQNGRQSDYRDSGPPLPPLPPEARGQNYGRSPPPLPQPSRWDVQNIQQRQPSLSEGPLPPQRQYPPRVQPQQYQDQGYDSPVSPVAMDAQRFNARFDNHQYPSPVSNQAPPYSDRRQSQIAPPYLAGPQHVQQRQLQQPYQSAQPPMHQPPAPQQPQIDLLSAPLEVTLPSQNSQGPAIPAPPIPPNPQKDAILTALSSTLVDQIRKTVTDNAAAIAPLQAQQVALRQAQSRLQSEIEQLSQLDAALSSNEKILHDAMRQADRVMEDARRRKVPDVDDVLVAPTVVGGQLYALCAEEKACADAMFVLGRALDKGRVSSDVFVKQTRSLARERFLKMALVKKIARGMGLDEGGRY